MTALKLLLANKAEPNERNNPGQTPLDLAKRPGHRGPSPAPAQGSSRTSMADLLRRHGATDDLPCLDCIAVRRPSANDFSSVFTKGTDDWNQFRIEVPEKTLSR